MNRLSSNLLFWCWVIIASILVTYWWFNSIYTIQFSESLWSQYNQLFEGQRPGVASDLEFVTVITGAIIIIGFLTRLTSWAIKRARMRQR